MYDKTFDCWNAPVNVQGLPHMFVATSPYVVDGSFYKHYGQSKSPSKIHFLLYGNFTKIISTTCTCAPSRIVEQVKAQSTDVDYLSQAIIEDKFGYYVIPYGLHYLLENEICFKFNLHLVTANGQTDCRFELVSIDSEIIVTGESMPSFASVKPKAIEDRCESAHYMVLDTREMVRR